MHEVRNYKVGIEIELIDDRGTPFNKEVMEYLLKRDLDIYSEINKAFRIRSIALKTIASKELSY